MLLLELQLDNHSQSTHRQWRINSDIILEQTIVAFKSTLIRLKLERKKLKLLRRLIDNDQHQSIGHTNDKFAE